MYDARTIVRLSENVTHTSTTSLERDENNTNAVLRLDLIEGFLSQRFSHRAIVCMDDYERFNMGAEKFSYIAQF